jgi:hypothetical protein
MVQSQRKPLSEMLWLAHMQGTTCLLEKDQSFTAAASGAWAGYDTPASKVKCHWQDMGSGVFPLPCQSEGLQKEPWNCGKGGAGPNKANIL